MQMTLNRKTPPAFSSVEKLYFPDFQLINTNGGVSVYGISAGTEPVLRLDFVFDGGLTAQARKGISAFTASMLSEGTKQRNGKELAESFDFLGAYFQTRSGPDDAVVTLYGLEKNLESALPLVFEAMETSIFPTAELDVLRKNSLQKLLVNETKTSYLAKKHFYKRLLGGAHAYAAYSEKIDLENLETSDLINFHQSQYLTGLKYVMLSGKFADSSLRLVADFLEKSNLKTTKSTTRSFAQEAIYGEHFIEKKDSVQAGLRLGKTTIGRSHPDFRKLQFVNLILGGYFGSRLMKNIREEKGLTYGIYSAIESMKEASVWYIDTEINSKNVRVGLAEIKLEMQRLREELVSKEELETAKNYYLGSFLRGLDGPFSLADRLKIMIDNQLNKDYYPSFLEVINNINAEQIRELSNKYLTEENLVEVLVGKK